MAWRWQLAERRITGRIHRSRRLSFNRRARAVRNSVGGAVRTGKLDCGRGKSLWRTAVPVMLDDDVVALWSRVRMLERRWWSRARRDPQLVRFCAEQGLMPENMMVHGEVLFCLAGLKPAVIVTGLPPAMMEEFVGSVLLAAGLNGFLAVLALFARAKDVSLTRSSRGNPARSPSNRLGRCQRSCSISPVPPSRIVLEDRL